MIQDDRTDAQKKALSYASFALSRRAMSVRELKDKLIKKDHAPEDADFAVSRLLELRLLDDTACAQSIVRAGIAKGYGKTRIAANLARRGISREDSETALSDFAAPDEALDAFITKKLRSARPNRDDIRRITDALFRRGHSYDDIKRALARYTDLTDEYYED